MCDENPAPNIELAFPDQKWVLDVFLDHKRFQLNWQPAEILVAWYNFGGSVKGTFTIFAHRRGRWNFALNSILLGLLFVLLDLFTFE